MPVFACVGATGSPSCALKWVVVIRSARAGGDLRPPNTQRLNFSAGVLLGRDKYSIYSPRSLGKGVICSLFRDAREIIQKSGSEQSIPLLFIFNFLFLFFGRIGHLLHSNKCYLRCGRALWQQSMMFETKINELQWILLFHFSVREEDLMRLITHAKTKHFKQRRFVLSYSGKNTV